MRKQIKTRVVSRVSFSPLFTTVLSPQPFSLMQPFGRSTKVKKADLNIGDIIWVNITIDPQDTADPGSNAASR